MVERHVAGDRLSTFLDDELADPDAMAVARHLDGCERCLRELASLRATRDALRALPALQAPVLTAGVQGRAHRASGRFERSRRAAGGFRLAVVAGSMSVLLAAAYVLGDDPGGIEPTTELFVVEHVARMVGGPVPTPAAGGDG